MKQTLRKYLSSSNEYVDSFRKFGCRGLLTEIKARKSIWSLSEQGRPSSSKVEFQTSITDRPSYLDICRLAVQNDEVLKSFKRCREYRLVLEHVSRVQGEEYFEFIKSDQEILQNLIEISSKEIGNPITYFFEGIGQISPTQIRYAKILSDIRSYFNKNRFSSVVEVGVGNGGQAVHLCRDLEVLNYYFVDLPEVLELTKKTIAPYNLNTNLHFVSPEKVRPEKADLFLSNYAFSELKKPIQDLYFEAYVKNSKFGYMLYNHIHDSQNESYSVFEIQKMIPNSIILPETPKTYPDNYLIIWGIEKNKINDLANRIQS